MPTTKEIGTTKARKTRSPQTGGAELEGLIARARKGDRRAFDALVSEARPRAFAVALKVLHNPDDAEDAVQEAFVKVWRYLGRFEGRASFSTWIHRIVMNASLDQLRRHGARPEGHVEEESDASFEHDAAPSVHDTPEHHVRAAEAGVIVHAALDRLPPAHRQALALRELEDRSYEEIAVAAHCPVGTVMSRLHHARKKLTAELRAAFSPEELALCAA